MSGTRPSTEHPPENELEIFNLPSWVRMVGYVGIAFRVPKNREYFYDSVRDKVLVCDTDETRPFVIVDYRGTT